jgi:hypothetical protein
MHQKDQLSRNQMDDTTRMEPVKQAKSIAVYLENHSCDQADTLQGYLFGNSHIGLGVMGYPKGNLWRVTIVG